MHDLTPMRDKGGTGGAATGTRVEWLDGVRALAAFFVVLHHAWLMTVGGYPGNNGPWYTDWLVYGHLAVSVFIVVSGFSLALSPARHGMKLVDGGKGFLRRRFWRIIPPYWAALAIAAALIATGVYAPDNSSQFGVRDFLIHALLLQDAVGNTSPNGAFWSIAVEWHIYFLFPLVLLGFRRYGVRTVLPLTAALVVGQHLLGQVVPAVAMFDRFTPAYLVLFVAGASAALLAHREKARRAAAPSAVLLAVTAVAFILGAGSEITVRNYFWVDLLVGGATAALFLAMAQGRIRWLASLLALRPLALLGSFAFSLYLIHAPVLAMITAYVVQPSGLGTLESLLLLLLAGCPASIAAAYAFFLVCERPFLTIRSLRQLAAELRTLISGLGARWSFSRLPSAAKAAPAPRTVQMEVTDP